MQYNTSFQTADRLKRELMVSGIPALDTLLSGGNEFGLVHLFYGNPVFQEDLLRAAVWAQLPVDRGGYESPVIIIDSSNMIDTVLITDYSSECNLEVEDVMDNIFVSRAFNSSQTYDLIINRLDEFLERIPARILLVPGLPDIFIAEGLTAEKLQQVTHMAARLMARTLEHELVTLVTTRQQPATRALSSDAQVHIFVERTPMRVTYSLTKHPCLPTKTESRMKYEARFGVTLPLDYYFGDLNTT